MKTKLTIAGIAVLLIVVICGAFLEIQTATEAIPGKRPQVIAYRVVWPWTKRNVMAWVPPRSASIGYRVVTSAKAYGFRPLRGALVLDAGLFQSGAAGQPPALPGR